MRTTVNRAVAKGCGAESGDRRVNIEHEVAHIKCTLPLAFASFEPHRDRGIDGPTVRSQDTLRMPGTWRARPADIPTLRTRNVP